MSFALSETERIIVVGDVHGCLSPLKKLINEIDLEPGDQLVFLGDMIDRGEETKMVIDYLMNLKGVYSCHFVMGNHEVMLLEYLESLDPTRWFANGGLATLKSYNSQNGLDLPDEHLEFIRNCPYFIETEHYFFTHGGLDPELSITDNLRYYKPEEFCWQQVHMRPSFIETNNYKWEKTVVCAHTPVSIPLMLDSLIAVDTGCVYRDNPRFGKLSAVVLPERRFVSVVHR
jgi:serine/threonine protein phosphatase 1